MTKSTRLFAEILIPAFVAAMLSVFPAAAQDNKADAAAPTASTRVIKEIDKNDKFHVYEVTYKPGTGSPSAVRSARVVHAITGGKLERTFEDGTKTTVEWKAGDTKIISEPKAYAVKNVGKKAVRLLVIEAK
jgi:hypothetical protein